jgi:hypothetical protein
MAGGTPVQSVRPVPGPGWRQRSPSRATRVLRALDWTARVAFLRVALPYVVLLTVHATARGSTSLAFVLGWRGLVLLVALVLWRTRSRLAPLAAFAAAIEVYRTVWSLAPGWGLGVHVDYAVAFDRLLGGGALPTALLQRGYGSEPLLHDSIAALVYTSFFLLPYLVLLVLWQSSTARAKRYVAAFALTLFASLAVIVLVPTAPPWMAAEQGRIEPVARIMLELSGTDTHEEFRAAFANNEVAAFPSVHTGVATVIALGAGQGGARRRRVAWLYPAAMGVALVYLGEHWAIDVLAGYAVALGAWRVSRRWSSAAIESGRDALESDTVDARAA